MPKKETDIRIEAHLSPDEYKQFEAIMQEKQWSKKKLAENIIRDYLNAYMNDKKR